MNKRRLFIAINLPENIKNKLVEHQRKWADLPVSWTIRPNLHITLVFIGDIGDNEMYEICNLVKEVGERHEPFNVNLERILLGPPNRPPRMFWVEGEKSEALTNLRNDLEDSLLNSKNSGYRKKELRAYKPHITSGRIKTGQWRELSPQPKIDEKFEYSFPVESVDVMQSNLKRTGPEYSVLESVNLGT